MPKLTRVLGSMSSLMAVDIRKEIPRKYRVRHAPLLILPVTSGQYGYIIHDTPCSPHPTSTQLS